MDESAILAELGRRIRAQRKRVGLTQEQLALIAGVDRSYCGSIERGERNITFTVLCRLAAAMEADIAALTTGLPAPVTEMAAR
ncbi:MAG TPA: helix-turn-helix transcriptional regulator [Novosphingobium sp.]|nr:helix-turn-helix transcriptional regulator [Novosphingobium sp.]